MKNVLRLTIALVLLTTVVGRMQAQTGNDARAKFDAFRQEAQQRYADFRRQVNMKYADFMEHAWSEFVAGPAIAMPKDQELRPQPMPRQDWDKPVQTRPIRVEEVVAPVLPKPQPMPISPIGEEQKPKDTPDAEPEVTPDVEPEQVPIEPQAEGVDFVLYGTPLHVRFSDKLRFTLNDVTERTIAEAWRRLSGPDYDATLTDCVSLRRKMHLCDWAYLLMLEQMAKACMGGGDAATLMMAYMYCQTGYQMRLGMVKGHLVMLFASEHQIYEQNCYEIRGQRYYAFLNEAGRMQVCDLSFPKEQPLSLLIAEEQAFAMDRGEERVLQSVLDSTLTARVAVNRNLIAFYNDYPSSMIGNDFMTRWALYANTPLQAEVQDQLYPQLQAMTEGKNEYEKVGVLLSFMHWAFDYRQDDEVWGRDRAFFAEETLIYPYSDCEDRSILFSRLVRDVFGLEVVLVYYPRHIATAVHFTTEVPGDYISLGGRRFTICDPTYIGAKVGQTMSDLNNEKAKVILLK
jgi:hypothetical protein